MIHHTIIIIITIIVITVTIHYSHRQEYYLMTMHLIIVGNGMHVIFMKISLHVYGIFVEIFLLWPLIL